MKFTFTTRKRRVAPEKHVTITDPNLNGEVMSRFADCAMCWMRYYQLPSNKKFCKNRCPFEINLPNDIEIIKYIDVYIEFVQKLAALTEGA